MKKSKRYIPYLFAVFMPVFSAISHNLLFKSGIVTFLITGFFLVLGLWRLVEWLLSRSENRLVRLGSVLLGTILYIAAFFSFDFYVLHLVLPFRGYSKNNIPISIDGLIHTSHFSKFFFRLNISSNFAISLSDSVIPV
jgi:hypothetical protein